MTTASSGSDHTGVLAAYVVGLGRPTIPPDVLRHAGFVLADTVGVLLAASREEAVRSALAAFPLTAAGPCTVVGVGRGAGAEQAALVNGIGGHQIELDDVHTSSRTHPACVVVPAALAAAELVDGCSGVDLLAAVIAGFDLVARVSQAMRVQPTIERGFHLSGVAGAIGAAAAAGRLLGLTVEQMRSAIALGAAQSSGLLTFEEDPSHQLKSFNTGAAARAGVCAAQLAAHGYRGAPDVLSGRHNALTSFGPADPDFEELTRGLGERFEITRTSLKRHACCSQMHAAVDTLLALQAEHAFSAKDVASIDVRLAHDGLAMIDGNRLWTHNIQYVLALAVRTGWVGPEHFSPAWTSDPDVAALATHVSVGGSDDLQRRFPDRQGAVVRVRTFDGADHVGHRAAPVGTPDEPMSEADLRAKFGRLAGSVLPAAEVEVLWGVLTRIDELDDLGQLFRLLAGPAGQAGQAGHSG